VDRAFSMGKLCKRLGEFVPGDYADEAWARPWPPRHGDIRGMFRHRAGAKKDPPR
jgi:hypothetical protein